MGNEFSGDAAYGPDNMPGDLQDAVERGQRIAEGRMSLLTRNNEGIFESVEDTMNVFEFARSLVDVERELRLKCEELRNEIAALKEENRVLKTRPGNQEDVAACLRVIQLLGGNRPNEEGND